MEEWGLDGIVMSDWFGSHSTAETSNAGLDLEMPRTDARSRRQARSRRVCETARWKPETVRQSALRMLRLMTWAGALDAAPDFTESELDLPKTGR